MSRKFLFNLAEDEARAVFEDDRGVLNIDSQHASDEEKKNYDAFVYDLYDGRTIVRLRNFFNKQYSLFFSAGPNWATRIFSKFFLPFHGIGNSGRILDVGCSTGLFLKYLPDTWQKYGVELNVKAVKIARDQGVNVSWGNLESYPADAPFDVIRMSHVLEHVKDYKRFLATAVALLRPGGWLVIYTPNSKSFSKKVSGRCWSGFYDQTHFNIFNADNLSELAREFNMETVFSKTYFTGFLGDSIMRLCKIKIGRSLAIVFLALCFPISFIERCFNRGDSLVMYFKKKI